jgi:hypothetical protein
MAGALAKAAHIRRIWRGRDLKIATSGVAKAQPKADLRCSEPGNVPGRQLTGVCCTDRVVGVGRWLA